RQTPDTGRSSMRASAIREVGRLLPMMAALAAFLVSVRANAAPVTTVTRLAKEGPTRSLAAIPVAVGGAPDPAGELAEILYPGGNFSQSPVLNAHMFTVLQNAQAGEQVPKSSASSITVVNPGFFGFDGLDQLDHRLADGGNQFVQAPPDQGLCVGAGYV